jgi:hypothetical protein
LGVEILIPVIGVLGLIAWVPRAAWLRVIGEAGFDVRAVPLVQDERPVGAEGFLATCPR